MREAVLSGRKITDPALRGTRRGVHALAATASRRPAAPPLRRCADADLPHRDRRQELPVRGGEPGSCSTRDRRGEGRRRRSRRSPPTRARSSRATRLAPSALSLASGAARRARARPPGLACSPAHCAISTTSSPACRRPRACRSARRRSSRRRSARRGWALSSLASDQGRGQAYDVGRERMRGFYEGAQEANPVTALASEVAGGFAGPVPAAGGYRAAAHGARARFMPAPRARSRAPELARAGREPSDRRGCRWRHWRGLGAALPVVGNVAGKLYRASHPADRRGNPRERPSARSARPCARTSRA